MNRKQLALLVVLLVILGGAGLLIQSNRNKSSDTGAAGMGQKILGEKFPINDVVHIVIKGGTNEVNLVKKSDAWGVKERADYPANFPQISDFLIKAAELKVIQSEEIGASQLPRMQLTPPGQGTNTGVQLELKGKDDKTLKTLLLGKKHGRKPSPQQMERFGEEGMADGRYVMAENNKSHVLLVGDPLSEVEPKPESWLNKDFVRVEKPKVITVTYPAAPTNSWKLARETEGGDWKLADLKNDEKLDTGKIGGLTGPFGSPTINDVLLPSAKPEDYGLDKPTMISVETFDNFIYTVKVGKKTGEDYPITIAVTADLPKERPPVKDEKPEDKDKADKTWKEQQKHLEDKLKREKAFGNWTYLVPGWNVESLLKERKDLLAEKKDETKKDDKSPAQDGKKDDLVPGDLPGLPAPAN